MLYKIFFGRVWCAFGRVDPQPRGTVCHSSARLRSFEAVCRGTLVTAIGKIPSARNHRRGTKITGLDLSKILGVGREQPKYWGKGFSNRWKHRRFSFIGGACSFAGPQGVRLSLCVLLPINFRVIPRISQIKSIFVYLKDAQYLRMLRLSWKADSNLAKFRWINSLLSLGLQVELFLKVSNRCDCYVLPADYEGWFRQNYIKRNHEPFKKPCWCLVGRKTQKVMNH